MHVRTCWKQQKTKEGSTLYRLSGAFTAELGSLREGDESHAQGEHGTVCLYLTLLSNIFSENFVKIWGCYFPYEIYFQLTNGFFASFITGKNRLQWGYFTDKNIFSVN